MKRVYRKQTNAVLPSDCGTSIYSWVESNLHYNPDPLSVLGGIENRITRGEQALGRLIEVLNQKGLVTDQEIFSIVDVDNRYWEIKENSND